MYAEKTYKLGAALASTLQYRAVQQEADGDVIAMTSGLIGSGQEFVGFALTTGASGDNIRVAGPNCECKAIAGATLTPGTHHLLSIDSVGRVIPWTAGSKACALWMVPKSDVTDRTVGAGEEVDVLVLPGAEAGGAFARGTVTIALGTDDQTATVAGIEDAVAAGAVVMLTTAGSAVDDTATAFAYSVSSDDSDTLTVTANANATAATDVAYAVIL